MRAGLVVTLIFLFWAGTAQATTVLLIRPENPTATTAEAMVRMHGELVSAGFDVQVLARFTAADARASLEAAAVDFHADAVVGIVGDPSDNGVEVWVIDKVTGKILVRQVPSDAPKARASEVLAVRSLELLRASFLEVAMTTSSESEKPTPPPVVQRYVAESMDTRFGFLYSLEIGGGVEGGWGGLGVGVTPHVRVGRVLFQNGFARMLVSGLGTRATVTDGETKAQLWQALALLDVGYQWRKGKPLRPRVFLGGGAARINGEGGGAWPFEGQTATQWSAVFDGGFGLDINLSGRFDMALELHARFMQPYPAIRFMGTTLTTVGHPGIVVQLGLLSWI